MQKYGHIIFDWDGTLSNSIEHIVVSLQLAGEAIGYKIPEEKARHIIGMGIEDARRYLLPNLQDDQLKQKFHQVYRENYLAREKEIKLYPYAYELIKYLYENGYTLSIATGKSREGILRALEHKGLSNYFSAIRTADMTKPKPNPNMVWELCAELRKTLKETILIGDTIHDLEMAKRAGISAVAVTYGAHPKKDLALLPHLFMVDSLKELLKYFGFKG